MGHSPYLGPLIYTQFVILKSKDTPRYLFPEDCTKRISHTTTKIEHGENPNRLSSQHPQNASATLLHTICLFSGSRFVLLELFTLFLAHTNATYGQTIEAD